MYNAQNGVSYDERQGKARNGGTGPGRVTDGEPERASECQRVPKTGTGRRDDSQSLSLDGSLHQAWGTAQPLNGATRSKLVCRFLFCSCRCYSSTHTDGCMHQHVVDDMAPRSQFAPHYGTLVPLVRAVKVCFAARCCGGGAIAFAPHIICVWTSSIPRASPPQTLG